MREPNSTTLPPRYVEYTIAEAVGLIFVTKASKSPLLVRSNALALVGKSVDPVDPVTYALPAASTVIAMPSSIDVPPRNVEYTRPPVGLSLATKASVASNVLTWRFRPNTPRVIGKFDDVVCPTM